MLRGTITRDDKTKTGAGGKIQLHESNFRETPLAGLPLEGLTINLGLPVIDRRYTPPPQQHRNYRSSGPSTRPHQSSVASRTGPHPITRRKHTTYASLPSGLTISRDLLPKDQQRPISPPRKSAESCRPTDRPRRSMENWKTTNRKSMENRRSLESWVPMDTHQHKGGHRRSRTRESVGSSKREHRPESTEHRPRSKRSSNTSQRRSIEGRVSGDRLRVPGQGDTARRRASHTAPYTARLPPTPEKKEPRKSSGKKKKPTVWSCFGN